MQSTKIVLLFALLAFVVMTSCEASPTDRQSQQRAQEVADAIKEGFNSFYQIARFVVHGDKMKDNP
jgi:hypothetical protein